MRLTLRTLLAYLDDILEPDDKNQIAKKIEESDFATNLVHRTRDCMRRLRLGVPALFGRGLAADPNTVAEYLDNTLAAERVGEFEKICLESDVHLAEVAACHQVLTLVLGESAEIPAASRQRMYQLASHVDAPPVQNDAMRPTATGMAPPLVPTSRRVKPEVPEYLRESRSRFWPLAAMVLIAAALTFAALAAFGPASLRERLTAWAPGSEASDEAEPAAEALASPAQPLATDATAKSDDDAEAPQPPEPRGASEPGAATPDVDPATTAESPEPAAATTGDNAPAPPNNEPAAAPLKPDKADKAESTDKPIADLAAPPAGDAVPESFGRYTSKQQVLLKFDAATSDWMRLPAMASLAKGDRLLSLPLFRPVVTLSSGITIEAEGAALFELAGWTEEGVPVLAVEFGRLRVRTLGKAGNALQLKLDDREAQLTFVDADSTLALEVARQLPPGKNPEATVSPLAVDLYVTSGLVRVRNGDAPLELEAPAHQILSGSRGDRGANGEFPKWVSSEALSELDRAATATLEPLLVPERPVALSLGELSTHRRREVRSLAIRGNAYLGNFEASIEALNDKDEKTLWPSYIEELRAAVARSPETAARVRSALERLRTADAAGLFRMLWGYSGEDLKNGADADLVEALNHDSLDFRVLALWNLQNATGLASFGYHPSDQAKQRSVPTRTWKEKLRQGKLVPRSAATAGKSKTPSKGG